MYSVSKKLICSIEICQNVTIILFVIVIIPPHIRRSRSLIVSRKIIKLVSLSIHLLKIWWSIVHFDEIL